MTVSYTYIITIGVIMLVAFSTSVLFFQQLNTTDYIAKRSALSVASSHVLSGIWSAVEEAKLTESGRELKSVSVGFPLRAEIGISPRTGDMALCVAAMGLTYERPLPRVSNVEYFQSGSGGDSVTVMAEFSGGRVTVKLVTITREGAIITESPSSCFR
ncbi:MAG: hypothetical protein NZ957_01345 [Thaumarchaeota archaeon]|nr:hypothetical protein [Candidatus Calditenuaceae archaeon]MDW8041709.1 hypothetical protein [Nitrososphaerota archaeon]